jgi:hypothetical protein
MKLLNDHEQWMARMMGLDVKRATKAKTKVGSSTSTEPQMRRRTRERKPRGWRS